jgi:DNA-binding transcriptional ArsR family regulator
MVDDQEGQSKSGEAADAGETPWLADDRFYRALASTRRRRLLSFVIEHTDSTVDELATVLAGWETTETGGMATVEDHDRVTLELVHSHLPLLEALGLVEYDADTGVVRVEDVDPVVEELITMSIEAEQTSQS